jgi:hypothetical protein
MSLIPSIHIDAFAQPFAIGPGAVHHEDIGNGSTLANARPLVGPGDGMKKLVSLRVP